MQMLKYFNMLISIYPPPTSFNHSAYLYYKMYIYFNKPSYCFFILSKKKSLKYCKALGNCNWYILIQSIISNERRLHDGAARDMSGKGRLPES